MIFDEEGKIKTIDKNDVQNLESSFRNKMIK